MGKSDDDNIIDISSVLLHLIGLPVPKDMDGNILTKLFIEGFDAARR